jgi:FkbM family methyltransferase
LNPLPLLEAVIGRRLMWKLGRRLYLYARREGSLDFDRNGEAALQRALAARSAQTGRGLNVVDVGANYGQWSRSLLSHLRTAGAPPASFTLFEPVPAIRSKLQALRDAFPEHEIRIEANAVSDQIGTASMVVTALEAGTHHLDAPDARFAGSMIEVPVTTLDAALEGSDSTIDIVKVDAEGFDPKVILGMQTLLARQLVDVVQFEYSYLFVRSRAYLYDLFQVATRHGYQVALITNDGFEVHPEWHPDLEHFYASAMALVSPRATGLLPIKLVSYQQDNTHA